MALNPDTKVNPFNAYAPPAFAFLPAAVGTSQLCANCGVTRLWVAFNYETGDYICGSCSEWWARTGGSGQPPDAVISQPTRFRGHNEGGKGLPFGDGVFGNGVFGFGSY